MKQFLSEFYQVIIYNLEYGLSRMAIFDSYHKDDNVLNFKFKDTTSSLTISINHNGGIILTSYTGNIDLDNVKQIIDKVRKSFNEPNL